MYNNIPKLQTGAYIPGLSTSIFGAGLARDIAKTQADIRSQARDIKRKQRSGSFFGRIGSMLGKAGMNLLTKSLMATNPLLAMGLKAAGTGLTSALFSKLGYGKDVGITKGSELLGSQFKDLSQFQEGIGKERIGSAVGAGLQSFAQDLKSEYGQKLMDSLRARRIDPTEQLGGSSNLGLDVVPTRKGSIESGISTPMSLEQARLNFQPTMAESNLDIRKLTEKDGVISEGDIISKGTGDMFNQAEGLKFGTQKANPFKMDMRNTELDYVSSKNPPPLVMGVVPENNEKLPENFYEVLAARQFKDDGEFFYKQPPMTPKSVEMPTMPKGTLLGKAKGIFNRETEFLRQLKELGPARMYGIGGDKFARETYKQGLLDNARLLMGDDIDPFADFPEEETPSVQNALLGLSNTVSQYNTPGMAHGGYVPEKGFGGLIQYRKGY